MAQVFSCEFFAEFIKTPFIEQLRWLLRPIKKHTWSSTLCNGHLPKNQAHYTYIVQVNCEEGLFLHIID